MDNAFTLVRAYRFVSLRDSKTGFVVGPVLSGLPARRDWHLDTGANHLVFEGFSIPFFVASGLAVATMPLVIAWLPELLAAFYGCLQDLGDMRETLLVPTSVPRSALNVAALT